MRTVDLFCGSGGMSAGLMESGFNVVAAFDDWSTAVATYNRNLGDHAHELDLSFVEEAADRVSQYEPELIVGGPPCQDFSSAGKRVEGKQANLTVAFAEIVYACDPRFVLMENVPQVRRSLAYSQLRATLSTFSFAEFILDASFCGVPQRRKRYFSFGWHQDVKSLTAEKVLALLEEAKSDCALTVKEYLADEIDIDYYYRHPRNYSRRSVFSVFEPSPTVRGVNRPVPPNYKGNHLDSVPPSTVRPLTSLERSRIQTFPSDWDWSAPDRNAETETQIGNAVPVQLAAFVGAGIMRAAIE
ncbi:MAG: DNA cytosine methyltransferase [Chloroflexota bacterium]|nr:DNA cytosine methyltransferase [Chloroflexota bacterium]